MMSGINYRALDVSKDAEVAAVAEIHERAPVYWTMGYIPTPAQILRRVQQLKTHEGCIDRFFQLAVTPDESIVGFHWIDMEEAEGEKCGHIKSLWVHDGFRHRGIATELKQNGELWAKQQGAQYLKTTVHASNPRMLEFNLRSGFEQGFIEMVKKL
jgi:GNAT superfamily N-acetyltransferase